MWIALVIVILAVLMMVGPLMAIRPTQSQARLAQMRQLALKAGLSVRVRQDPNAYRKGQVAVYTINLPEQRHGATEAERQQSVRKANQWLLSRREYVHELHFQGEWDWQGKDRPTPALQAFLKQHLAALDGSFLAVESTGHSFGLYWTESRAGRTSEERVEEVAAWLKTLVEHEPVVADRQPDTAVLGSTSDDP